MSAERKKYSVAGAAGKAAATLVGASAAVATAAVVAASVALAPQAAPQARLNGIHEDLLRAV